MLLHSFIHCDCICKIQNSAKNIAEHVQTGLIELQVLLQTLFFEGLNPLCENINKQRLSTILPGKQFLCRLLLFCYGGFKLSKNLLGATKDTIFSLVSLILCKGRL